MPTRFEWGFTLALDVLTLAALAYGYLASSEVALLAAVGLAAMTLGFGHRAKRAE